jgi:hypothetical protein
MLGFVVAIVDRVLKCNRLPAAETQVRFYPKN